MKIEIKSLNGKLLFSHEQENNTIAITLMEAIRQKVSLAEANFSGANFSGANFIHANFSRADFSEANFIGANFSGANFSRANFSGANFSGANFIHADFSRADFSEANFGRANFIGANFSGANFSRANFIHANFSGANFIHADFSRADFSEANGIFCPISYLKNHFEYTADGLIAYKTFGEEFPCPAKWVLEPGSVISENANTLVTDLCGCGVNVATLKWVKKNYHGQIWKVLIRLEWLASITVPWATDGKIRVGRCELVEKIER